MPVGSVSVSVPRERRLFGSQSTNQTDQESMESIEGTGEGSATCSCIIDL
jgi:hypothetical protein